MKKLRQIAALIGIILLVALYGITIFAAILDSPETMHILAASLAATFIIPVVLWVLGIFWRIRPGADEKKEEDSEASGETTGSDPEKPDVSR